MTATCSGCGQTWERDPALAVPCPTCGARAGSRCKRPSGHECEVHVERDRAALAGGFIERCPAAPVTAEQGFLWGDVREAF